MTEPSVNSLLTRLHKVRQEIAALKVQEHELEDQLAEIMPKRVEIPGMGAFEKQQSKDRKAWMHDDLFREMLKQAHVNRHADPETGELESVEEALLRELRECAQISYWRATALKARGLAVDEYCESSPGRTSIRFYGDVS